MFGFGKKKDKAKVNNNITDADIKAAEKDLGVDKMPGRYCAVC